MSLKAFDSLNGNDVKKASEVLEMMKKVRTIFAQSIARGILCMNYKNVCRWQPVIMRKAKDAGNG